MYYQIEIRDKDTGKVLKTKPVNCKTSASERKEIATELIGNVADKIFKICEVLWRDGVPADTVTYYSNKHIIK